LQQLLIFLLTNKGWFTIGDNEIIFLLVFVTWLFKNSAFFGRAAARSFFAKKTPANNHFPKKA